MYGTRDGHHDPRSLVGYPNCTCQKGECQRCWLTRVYELVVTHARKESRTVFPEGGAEERGVGKQAKKEYPPLQNQQKRKAERSPKNGNE